MTKARIKDLFVLPAASCLPSLRIVGGSDVPAPAPPGRSAIATGAVGESPDPPVSCFSNCSNHNCASRSWVNSGTLEIGRGNRPESFNLMFSREPAFVPRDLRFEVNERMTADGAVDDSRTNRAACQSARELAKAAVGPA